MLRRPPPQLFASASRPVLPFVVLAVLLAIAVLPSAALAVPKAPELLETNPVSPGVSLTPRIVGRPSGRIIKEVWRPDRAAVTPQRLAGIDSNGVISIYTTADCAGAPIASGSTAELETDGIAVAVVADSTTDFYATQTESGETSPCSEGIEYRQVTAPPPAPVVTSVDPAGPADDNAPQVLGTAADGTTVSIYADPTCAGAPLGTGAAAAFANPGIQVAVADNSTTTFYAAASWAGLTSPCSSSSVAYQEVTAAPATGVGGGESGGGSQPPSTTSAAVTTSTSSAPARPTLHTVPGGRANDLTPLLVAAAPGAARVDVFGGPDCHGVHAASGSAAELAAGVAVAVAPNATTTFSAAAVGANGRSRCSSSVTYTEDSLPPRTRITMGPRARTRRHWAVFRFTDVTEDPPGTAFRCKVNKRKWRPCASPLRLKHLKPRRYLVRIQATDLAGNVEPTPVKRRFTVVPRRSRGA